MLGPADIKSFDGLIDWHAALATFRHDALECIASLDLEVRKSTDYLEEQLRFWREAVRDCEEDIIQCKYDLNRRQMPDFSGRMPDCSVQEEALRRAEQKLDYAQEQVTVVRKWITLLPRELDEVYQGIARRYVNFLEGDVQRALNLLQNQIKSLEAYFQLQAESSAPPPPPPSDGSGASV
jgi:hypothetical protein